MKFRHGTKYIHGTVIIIITAGNAFICNFDYNRPAQRIHPLRLFHVALITADTCMIVFDTYYLYYVDDYLRNWQSILAPIFSVKYTVIDHEISDFCTLNKTSYVVSVLCASSLNVRSMYYH